MVECARKRIHNGCAVRIENSVTRDNWSSSLGKPHDAKQLYSWRNFQSAPHNHSRFLYTTVMNVTIKPSEAHAYNNSGYSDMLQPPSQQVFFFFFCFVFLCFKPATNYTFTTPLQTSTFMILYTYFSSRA